MRIPKIPIVDEVVVVVVVVVEEEEVVVVAVVAVVVVCIVRILQVYAWSILSVIEIDQLQE